MDSALDRHIATSTATAADAQVDLQSASQAGDAQRFALALLGTTDGLWDWNLADGSIYFSPHWKSMLGYADDEMPNDLEEWRQRIHPDDAESVLAAQRGYLAGTAPRYVHEYRLRHKDGSYRWVLTRGTALRDEAGVAYRMVGWHTDITERREAEEQLRLQEQYFRALFEQSPIPTVRYAPDGHILRANAAALELFGITAEQAPKFNLFTDAQAREHGVTDCFRRAFAGEAVAAPPSYFDPTRSSLGGHGSPRWLKRFLYPIKTQDCCVREVVVTYEDITEQCQAEEQLREKEEQYRSIFETTSDAIIINTLDGVVAEANPAACALHGYTYEELIGLRGTAFIHPDSHAVFEEYLERTKAGHCWKGRAVDVRKDGSLIHIEVSGSPLTFRGQPHLLAVVRDITERVEAYRLLEQRVEERTRELAALIDISQTVASTLELEPLLEMILDQLKAAVNYTGSAIMTLDGDASVIVGYRGPIPAARSVGMRFPIAEAAAVWEVLTCGEPVIIPDVYADEPLANSYRASLGDRLTTAFAYLRAWMGVPLTHKGRIIGLLSCGSVTPGYYTEQHARLAMGIASQAAIALENAHLYQQTQELAKLEERQKLARELHDSVSQALYGIGLGARTARVQLDRDPAQVAAPLDYVLSLAEAGMAEMRALIFELRPESLAMEGLVVALKKQAAMVHARHNIEVREAICDEPEIALELKEALYRIAQESLHNTIKHSRAQSVDLTLAVADGRITLEVRDDGQGFDPTGEFPGHLGLRSMRERVARAGGEVTITSAPGQGTTIRAWLPAGG
jgi:PAS domain S-box-containing protein